MGYTHHWYKKETITDDDPRWKKVLTDARHLIARSETPLSAGLTPDFTDPPIVEEDQVVIDGYTEQMAAEPFSIPLPDLPDFIEEPRPGFRYGWCKTNRNPYDQVVCAILISVRHHFGDDITLYSDGDIGEEWLNGADPDTLSPLALYRHIFPARTIREDLVEEQTLRPATPRML